MKTITAGTTDSATLSDQTIDTQKPLSIKQHVIINRHKRSKVANALPTDFEIDQGVVIDQVEKSCVSPYAFDYETKEFLLTKNDVSIIEKPFFYQAQFENASGVITLPLALADSQYGPYNKSLRPTFIFSIGRCGSTLMTKLTECIGKGAVSEPDILSVFTFKKRQLAPNQADQVLFYTLRSLECFFGMPANQLVVKLRSASNSSAPQIYRNFPNSKYIFMLRDLRSWSKSFITTFNWSTESLYNTLLNMINALEFFKKNNISIHLISYEDLITRPEHVISILLNEDETPAKINKTLLADIMSRHSQSGTGLEDKPVGDSAAIEARVNQFLDFWHQKKPVQKLRYINIDL